MKKYLIYLSMLATTLLIGCDSFQEMSGVTEVEPISVNVDMEITVENVAAL